MKKVFLVFLVAMVSLVGAVFAASDTAQAAEGNCFFTQTNYYVAGTGSCSVSGYGDYAVNDVLTGRNGSGGGSAMPESSVNSKSQFISYITNKFNSGGTQDKVGSAFTIQRMRGVNNWPSATEVTDWVARMNSSEITFHSIRNQRVTSSSWYDTGKRNVFVDERTTYRDVVEIRHNGSLVIQIIRACGNPTALQVDTLPGLWDIAQETRAKNNTGNPGVWASYSSGYSQTAEVGQQVLFMHRIRNAGNANTPTTGVSAVVQTFYTSSPGGYSGGERTSTNYTGWSPAGVALSARSLAKGAEYYYYNGGGSGNQQELRKTVENRVGQYLCQRIATPGSQGDTRWEFSRPACLRIVAAPWNITGSTRIKNGSSGTYGTSQINAAPGNMLYWDHRLERGGSGTPSSINYRITRFVEGGSTSVLAESSTTAFPFSRSADTTASYRYTVRQDDVGRRVCQSMRWNPTAHNNTGQTTTQACAFIPYNYRLTPSLTSSTSFSGGAIEPGASLNINRIVRNAGPTKSRDAEWRMSEVIVRQGTGLPNEGGGTSNQAPCSSYFRPASGSCEEIDRGTGVVFNPGDHPLGSVTRTIGDLNVGDRVCWALSVNNHVHNSPAGEWRHSQLYCLTVGKTPKVQLWGSDVRSNSTVSTGISSINGRMYGSWAEYAIMSSGTVSSSSGAGLSSGNTGRPPVSELDRNRLTFANAYSGTPSFGNFTATIPSSTFPPNYTDNTGTNIAANSTVNLGSTASGVYRSAGNLTIAGGEVAAGKTLIIKAPASTVTITGDITYANGPYTDTSSLPQLVISARNIVIRDNVNVVNAWLIARSGYISTCNVPPSSGGWASDLNSNVCNQRLAINGPTIASKLYLRRTFGADVAHRGSPAEILNLRPDAYLRGQATSSQSSSIGTEFVKELPPRF